MSRIGKAPVEIPAGVDIAIDGSAVTVKGKLGKLTRSFSPVIKITKKGSQVLVERPDDERASRSLHGLTRALINNMVIGVKDNSMRRKAAIKTGKVSANGFDVSRLSNYVSDNMRALKEVGNRIADDPKKAREFLFEAGIITKSGKLSPNYRGNRIITKSKKISPNYKEKK